MRSQIILLFAVAGISESILIGQEEINESSAIEKIELLGGRIERDETLPDRPVVSVSFNATNRFNDKYIHLLRAFTNLTKLDLSDATITDLGLKQIGKLT